MKFFLQRYGTLTLGLSVLFASGVAAGYQWGIRKSPERPVVETVALPSVELTPRAASNWSENAALALQRDLGLTEAQTETVRRNLTEPYRLIMEEKHRGNLKIHLRLLEAHDTLSANAGLTDKQKTLLKARREQLRLHILDKFRDLIGDKPDPILGSL